MFANIIYSVKRFGDGLGDLFTLRDLPNFRREDLMYYRLYGKLRQSYAYLVFIQTNSSNDIPPSPSKSILSIVDLIQSSSRNEVASTY